MTTAVPTTPEPVLVHVQTAAAMLGVCPRTVYTLVKHGQLPIRHIGRAARIHVDDIRRYAASLATPKAVAVATPREDVVKALGLTMADLMPASPPKPKP